MGPQKFGLDSVGAVMGQQVTYKWAVGIAFAVLMALGGYTWSSTLDRVLALERERSIYGERIASLEAEARALRFQLDRMESKLDRIAERQETQR